MKQEVFYKIKRRSDDLFSSGGLSPTFSKKGKIWRNIGHLRSHLSNLIRTRGQRITYNNCDIIEYFTIENNIWEVEQEIQNSINRKEERDKVRAENYKNYQEQLEKQKLKELLEKYGDKNV